MKAAKQQLVLNALASGRYKVEADKILSKVGGVWREIKYGTLPSGYNQVAMFCGGRGVGKNQSARVYRHIVIYLANNGPYKEGLVIDHLDRNHLNNMPDNLALRTHKQNVANQKSWDYPEQIRPIRGKEIASIRELMSMNLSQAEIARQLNLGRLAVRYVYNKIKTGQPLKYEGYSKEKRFQIPLASLDKDC